MMRLWKRGSILLLSMIAGFMLTACRPVYPPVPTLPAVQEVPEQVDTGLMTNKPCAPPCWQGIHPGDSREDAIRTLRGLSRFDATAIRDSPETANFPGGLIWFDGHGRVMEITYVIDYRLRLQELIDLRGPPDGFWLGRLPQIDIVIVNMLWPAQGFWVGVESSLATSEVTTIAPVGPDSGVYRAGYFEPVTSAEDYFRRVQGLSPDESLQDEYWYVPWEGYAPVPAP